MSKQYSESPTDYEERARRLHRFADCLAEEIDTLGKSLVEDVEITIGCAKDRDLSTAIALLRENRADYKFDKDPGFHLKDRKPFGKVAIMLPYNSVGLCAAMAVGGAYMAGNEEILVRMPGKIPKFIEKYRKIIEACLPGVKIVGGSGREFLENCFADPSVKVVDSFGDDKWMVRYYREARLSKTKTIFEGPGKDPFIVHKDADVAKAADAAVRAGFANAGQSCSSPERFYVHDAIHGAFVEKVVELASKVRTGPASSPETDVGPIGSPTVIQRLISQFEDARSKGGRVLLGGKIVQEKGNNFQTCLPTVIANCHHRMDLLRDETFGPVIAIVNFASDEEVLAYSEDSAYGLTATVYGGSEEFAKKLGYSHGSVFHNSCIVDPQHKTCRMFWGGFRNSAWIWEWQGPYFLRKEGPRYFVKEFSQPL